eukprot:4392912-Amphidinium_carterae.1
MTADGKQSRAEFLLRHVFLKRQQKALEFVPILKRYAEEGRSFSGVPFKEQLGPQTCICGF